jgi:hypothetical protein
MVHGLPLQPANSGAVLGDQVFDSVGIRCGPVSGDAVVVGAVPWRL